MVDWMGALTGRIDGWFGLSHNSMNGTPALQVGGYV